MRSYLNGFSCIEEEFSQDPHGITVNPDKLIDKVEMEEYNATICPGGSPEFKLLREKA